MGVGVEVNVKLGDILNTQNIATFTQKNAVWGSGSEGVIIYGAFPAGLVFFLLCRVWRGP